MAVSGFCVECSGIPGVYITACLSIAGCFTVLVPSLYCMVQDDAWLQLRQWLNSELVESHQFDLELIQRIWRTLEWLDAHHHLILAVLVFTSFIHLISTVLLILATITRRRNLLIPWMVSDLVAILVMFTIFLASIFVTYFIDLLVSIVFPVIAGLTLGIWIVLWRNTVRLYRQLKYVKKIRDSSS